MLEFGMSVARMRSAAGAIVFLAAVRLASAQPPNGSIAGLVRDVSGRGVPAARVSISNPLTNLSRAAVTSEEGGYSFPALVPGEYAVSVEAPGFQRSVTRALVEAGLTTTADFMLEIGDVKESVDVPGIYPHIQYDSHTFGGVVTQEDIRGLPLNGRSFLELAKLEPGVQPPSRANNNRTFVSILGGPPNGRATRVTVDGGSIMAIGSGGSAMGLSQEAVQEFQVSSVNFDLATGITDQGAINVITRSGNNELHGTAFFFFRDHTIAAYPGLKRDPADLHPFFQRRQFGAALGGPIRRDRLFFFGNWERNEQRGVVATTLLSPDFVRFSRITPTPLIGDQFSLRLDGRISSPHTAFLRYSHDGSRAFGPTTFTNAGPNPYPSNWTRQLAWADQSLLGLTSVLRPTVVNDLRLSYFFTSSSETAPEERDCSQCLGIGAPGVNIPQAGLFFGRYAFDFNLARQFQTNDMVTWQRGAHRARFGIEWEYHRGGNVAWLNEPASITLFSPDQVRTHDAQLAVAADARIPLPPAFRTLEDILRLPLQSFTVSVGDPRVPQSDGGTVRHWNTVRIFFEDAWRVAPRLIVNYGLGWNIDRNLNYDLGKAVLLAPVLGSGHLGPTRKRWDNFSPVFGLAWAASSDRKTVFRAGSGIYYDFLISGNLDAERAILGPAGLGRQTFQGSSIPNSLTGVPGVPVGTPLDFRSAPTLFTGADLMTILPAIRAGLTQNLASADRRLQAVQIIKQISGGVVVLPDDVPSPSAIHFDVGIQREIARDFVLSLDGVLRKFVHSILNATTAGGGIDLNHFNSTRGPVIPVCTTAQRNDPQAVCSLGPFNIEEHIGRATYKGVLFRAEKRLSKAVQFLGSYAYSGNNGTNPGNGFNLDGWLQNQGPLSTDFTHILNLAALLQLPRGIEVGLNFSFSSAPPFTAYVGGIDFNGDGTTGDLLPGTTVNAFNRGMRRADLEKLVTHFNATYAFTKDGHGVAIPRLVLPAQYALGDNVHSLDLRLSRSFVFHEGWRVSLIGEVFNLYNKANLTGYGEDLTSGAFGQPTSRATQVFGSGGPRAFQMAMRVAF